MSKDKKPKGAQHSHRAMLPTNAAIDNIKNQFKQHIGNKVVVQGANYSKQPEQEVTPEQQHAEAMQVQFYPFPTSGLICEWVSNPTRPGVFVVVVNIEPDPTKEPKPGFFATTRQHETAQMICDGINFLFKCQKEMAAVGIGEDVKPTVFAPVVLPDAPSAPTVDSTPTLPLPSDQ